VYYTHTYTYVFINDLPNTIIYSDIFLFADDAKLIRIVNSDIANLRVRCDTNRLSLDINKRKFTHFHFHYIDFQYTLFDFELVSQFKDLEIIFDTKLKFIFRSETINNETVRDLGFIKRTCVSFPDPISLKILYRSLARSSLEYCPLIWMNNTLKPNNMLERVQNHFVRFISFKFHIQ